MEWLKIKHKPSHKIDKKLAFEYFVYYLIVWWSEVYPEKEFEENNLSTLKVMRLLFLTSAVDSNKDDDVLLKIFDNWSAKPPP